MAFSSKEGYRSTRSLAAASSLAIKTKRGASPAPNGFSFRIRSPGSGPLGGTTVQRTAPVTEKSLGKPFGNGMPRGGKTKDVVSEQIAELLKDRILRHGNRRKPPGIGQHVLRHGAAILGITVQEVRICLPPHNQGQFPSQIEGILHARVHALSSGRTVNMGSIAGDEHPAHPVGIHLPLVDAKRRQPDRPEKAHRSRDAAINDLLDFFQGGIDSRSAR